MKSFKEFISETYIKPKASDEKDEIPFQQNVQQFPQHVRDQLHHLSQGSNFRNALSSAKVETYDKNTFYYYDNQHTTGTDAKILLGSHGIALIGKNSRERDVVQGMYRMRQLGKSDDEKLRHTITFILNNNKNLVWIFRRCIDKILKEVYSNNYYNENSYLYNLFMEIKNKNMTPCIVFQQNTEYCRDIFVELVNLLEKMENDL